MRQRKKTAAYNLRRVQASEDLGILHKSLEEALNFESATASFDQHTLTPEQRRANFGLIVNEEIDEDD